MARRPKALVANPGPMTLSRLWDHCAAFVRDQRISCPETIHQCDRVIENAYGFIEGIAEITGYAISEDDDDDD